jgi:hypothetical protein
MYGQSLLLLTLLALQQSAGAAKTRTECFTQRTSPSPKTAVRTTSRIKTITFTRPIVVTTTPGKTITPPAVTFTVTETDTATFTSAVPQVTDTATETVFTDSTLSITLPTQTETDSITVTQTLTVTADGTTTVPTPPG